jgi:transglutaminase-like putative cysteine protease
VSTAAITTAPASAPLDVRNVLWLLASMVFVVAPHVPRLPYWIAILCAIVVAWRAWIAWAAWHFPRRPLMLVLTFASIVGIWLTYRTLFGREAGVALLITMAALKLLEMRTQREVTLAIYLGFFLVLTSFLFSQSIPLGIYMLVCVWIFVATWVGFNRVGRAPTLGERLRPAAALLVQALPLMAAFFLLFPRVQGPLWALPRDTATARTGLSDTMSPGNIANLIKSGEVAFRVQFEGERPPYGLLYWRGPVLTEFDGRSWRMPELSSLAEPRYSHQEKLVRYGITLEPPPLDSRNPYDEFLFETKRGFCEHYAGTFTLMMRAAGIPARVVTGYQGGEVNPLNGELIVRQADAHAWSEVWLPDEGWVRIDPTAAVSPLRVEGGVNAALGPIDVMSSIIASDSLGVLAYARYTWHMMNSNWDLWVIGYNTDKQRQFFTNLGLPRVDWHTLAFWLVVATFTVGAAISIGLLVRDRPRRREPSVIAWQRYCTKLAAAGIMRAPHEGPLDFLARVKSTKPQIAGEAEEITRRYVEARYGAGASRQELAELARRVRELRAA